MSRNDYPPFLAPSAYSARVHAADCRPRLRDLPLALQPAVLLEVARKVYATHYRDPLQSEALALRQAGEMLAIIRYQRRDSESIAAELGVSNGAYLAALRVRSCEARLSDVSREVSEDVSKDLRVYGHFLDELAVAVSRVRPGPEQLRARDAALADLSQPNRLWLEKFLREGMHRGTAEFMANLQEKLARELPESQRHAFIRDCEVPGLNVRSMVLAFRAQFIA
jgi:hypothetical protein